jgi:hypothetical protein
MTKTSSKNQNFDIELNPLIKRLAELGLGESEIVYSLGLTKSKFEELKKEKGIRDALEKGAKDRAHKVEEALYRRAVGFEYEEVLSTQAESTKPSVSSRSRKSSTEIPVTGGLKSEAKSTLKTVSKTVIPDVTACIFWLKNRLPDKWKEPKDINDGKLSLTELIENYSDEDDT